jgi:RimJ/RimL family protein N-acetyltransferase
LTVAATLVLAYPVGELTHGAISVRPWTVDDLALVEEASNDADLLSGTTLPRTFSASEGLAFIERQWGRRTNGEGVSLAVAIDGGAVGCTTLMLRRPGVADLGYWLVRRARGRGIGGSAVGLVVDWGLGRPEIDAIEAFVHDDNTASRRLLEGLGFTLAGRRRHQVNDVDAELLVYRRG